MLTKSLLAVESFARVFLSQHETEIAIIFFYFFCYCDVQTAFRMRHFFGIRLDFENLLRIEC